MFIIVVLSYSNKSENVYATDLKYNFRQHLNNESQYGIFLAVEANVEELH